MANTFELIASSTVGAGGASSIDFTSIVGTYTDLAIKYSLRSSSTTDDYLGVKLSFNSSTTSFTIRQLYGTGSTAGSGNYSTNNPSGYMQAGLTTASTFASGDIYIPNYAGSTNKSFSTDSVAENNAATANFLSLLAGLWSNTAAITSISLTPATGNFVQYSTAVLYGIKNS